MTNSFLFFRSSKKEKLILLFVIISFFPVEYLILTISLLSSFDLVKLTRT